MKTTKLIEAIYMAPIAASVPVEIVTVHDGDTFSVNIPGWPDIVGKHMLVRLYGVDAPELHDPRPNIAKLAEDAHQEMIKILANTPVILTSLRRDKYFRLLCTVTAAGADVATTMKAAGLVRDYPGHGPKPW